MFSRFLFYCISYNPSQQEPADVSAHRLGGTCWPLSLSRPADEWDPAILCCRRIQYIECPLTDTDHTATWARPLCLNIWVTSISEGFSECANSPTVFPDGSNKMYIVLFILCASPQPALLSLITLLHYSQHIMSPPHPPPFASSKALLIASPSCQQFICRAHIVSVHHHN